MRERWVLLATLLVASPIACEGSGAAPTANAVSTVNASPLATAAPTAPPTSSPLANAAPTANVASPAPSLSSPLREEAGVHGGQMVRLGAHFRHHISGTAMGDGRVKGTCAATPQLTSP